jgi:DNA-directed RNA polymerase specialized sigma24 family protein
MEQEELEALLGWFEPALPFVEASAEDEALRERAGDEYTRHHESVIKILRWRNCPHAENLADLTFDRIAKHILTGKIQALEREKERGYLILGYARKICQEQRGKLIEETGETLQEEPPPAGGPPVVDPAVLKEERQKCLDECVNRLPSQQQVLLIEYYRGEKQEKIMNRKEMAENLGLTAKELSTKVYHLREELKQCVFKCVEHKQRRSVWLNTAYLKRWDEES